ncbi:MAG: hypothetical protein Q8P26_04950 [Candidatus Levybacteria bacterium]|nr:hypothetical protein [Candidatus Levybacteria bacterium]
MADNFKFSIWTLGYLIAVIGLFLYSFTQIDLGLTLSEASIWQIAEGFFKNIGYFQRPLSGNLFVGTVLSLLFFYLMILYGIYKKKINKKTVWVLIISTAFLLNFSYNAFSHDLFNYIFDAKIVTYYNQNPYIHRALDFPGDPMLSFMHWTHRLYPYGPIWLGLTVPLSFVGFQFFLPTFFLFKTLMSLSFLGTAFFIGKILKKVSLNDEVFGIAFFALNPLVVVESLVSSHNDIVMIFFAMWSIYLLLNIQYARSLIMFMLSVGIKFATLFMLPIFLIVYSLTKQKKKINWEIIFSLLTILMIIPVVLASYRTNFQPWYLLNILPFAALVSRKYYFFVPAIVLSFFSLFQYLPFLYLGNWDNPVPLVLFRIMASAVIVSAALVTIGFFKSTTYKSGKMVK